MVQKVRQPILAAGGIQASSASSNTFGLPIVDGVSAVAVSRDELRAVRMIELEITELTVTMLAANDYGSSKISDLPDTNLLVVGAECDLVVTKAGTTSGIVATTDLICGIGTTATADTTIGTTDQNIIPATTLSTDALAVDLEVHNLATTFAGLGILDGSSNAIYFNVAVTGSNPSADDSISVSGTLRLFVLDLGNMTS